jgi:hypothetical protein
MGRLEREQKSITAMIRLYCKGTHARNGNLCLPCKALQDYAIHRIIKCPHEQNKPSCAKCQIHCFRSEMREQVRVVMRYAGPRMLLRHPILAILHSLDSLRSGSLDKAGRLARSLRAARPGPALPDPFVSTENLDGQP